MFEIFDTESQRFGKKPGGIVQKYGRRHRSHTTRHRRYLRYLVDDFLNGNAAGYSEISAHYGSIYDNLPFADMTPLDDVRSADGSYQDIFVTSALRQVFCLLIAQSNRSSVIGKHLRERKPYDGAAVYYGYGLAA